jgi:hypothetical protein
MIFTNSIERFRTPYRLTPSRRRRLIAEDGAYGWSLNNRRSLLLFVALLVAWTLGSSTASAQFLPSQLRALSRSGGQIDTKFDLAVTIGDRLDEVDAIDFSHPGITAELKTLDPLPFTKDRRPNHGQFTVHIAADVPAGRYEVRSRGRHGSSNPRTFLVSPLANELVSAISHDRNSPTPLPLDTLLHAEATPSNFDYFGLDVGENPSLRIELLAQRVESRMIGQLSLYDADNRIVAASRGADDLDPLLTLEGLSAGQYVLAVHDFLYRGGGEFHYQLVAQPADSSPAPIQHAAAAEGQLPLHWPTRACTVREQELHASGHTAAAESIEVPGEATRWFASDHSDSLFEFSANEGEQFAIDIVSQRLLQPTDARLIVQRIEPQQSGPAKLHDVLNVDDGQQLGDAAVNLRTKDPTAMFKAPATASYRVTVRDLDHGQMLSARQQFRLQVGQPIPGFDLVAYRPYPNKDANQSQAFGSKLFRGGTEGIRIFAIRRDGWKGPIRVTAENLPAGVTCREGVIAANQNQIQLTLLAAEDADRLSGAFQIVGHNEDNQLSQRAVPATIVWGRGGGRDFIRSRISSSLYVAVSDLDLSPLSITLGDDKTIEVKQGQSAAVPIKVTRRDGGKGSIVLRRRDFPSGVTAGDVTVAADKTEGNLALKVAAKAAVGTYSLWLQAETKIKVKPNPQSLERAQQYRAHLQSLHDDPAQADKLESIKSAISAADKQVEAAKSAAKEQELTVFIPTTHATLRVVQP